MSEYRFLPLQYKYTNNIYGIKQDQPNFDSDDYLLDKLHQNAKVKAQEKKFQILTNLKKFPQLPVPSTPQKNRQQVDEIIKDINEKGLLSWMLTKSQMRKFNKQNRLGNQEYTSNVIKKIQQTAGAQQLLKQSTLFCDELVKTISPTSSNSRSQSFDFNLRQRILSPNRFQFQKQQSTISTQEKNIPNRQSILLNNYKSQQSLFREQQISDLDETTPKQSEFSIIKQISPVSDSNNSPKKMFKAPPKIMSHLRTGSLPLNLTQSAQNDNQQKNILSSFKNQQPKKSFKKSILQIDTENINLKKAIELKQMHSSDNSTRYNSTSNQQTFLNYGIKKSNSGFLSDRQKIIESSKNQQNQQLTRRSKMFTEEERVLENYIKQNRYKKSFNPKEFKMYNDIRKSQTWRNDKPIIIKSLVSEEFQKFLLMKEEQKIILNNQFKEAQEQYNLEGQQVITEEMKQTNKNIMNSPLFEFQHQEPYRKTFLLYDYLEDDLRFKEKKIEEEMKIPNIKKCEAYKKFNHFIQKYRIVQEF